MSYLLASKVYLEHEIRCSEKRMAKYNLCEVGKIIKIAGYEESQGEKTITDFGNALYEMKIGTPFEGRDEMYEIIEHFLSHNSSIWNNGVFLIRMNIIFLTKEVNCFIIFLQYV